MFPDVIESLALGHLEKGDHMSAMITSEWWVCPFYDLPTGEAQIDFWHIGLVLTRQI